MAIAFPPAPSISLTTEAAASAPFEKVIATFAPSAASRLAIAAPIPREPPVTSAALSVRFAMMGSFGCFDRLWSAREPREADHRPASNNTHVRIAGRLAYGISLEHAVVITGRRRALSALPLRNRRDDPSNAPCGHCAGETGWQTSGCLANSWRCVSDS